MKRKPNLEDTMRPEYDLRAMGPGVRGKYFKRYWEGRHVIVLDDDLAALFPDSASVNEALRALVRAAGGAMPASVAKRRRRAAG
jgi:hypothetical protein